MKLQKVIEMVGDGHRVSYKFGSLKMTSSGSNGWGPFGSPAGYQIKFNAAGKMLAQYVIDNSEDELAQYSAQDALSGPVSEDRFANAVYEFARLVGKR